MFSGSRWVIASLFFLFLAGGANIAYNATNNTLLQLNVPDAYRGRVISIFFLNRGIVPLGTAATGWLAEKWGAPIALGSMAGMLIMLGLGPIWPVLKFLPCPPARSETPQYNEIIKSLPSRKREPGQLSINRPLRCQYTLEKGSGPRRGSPRLSSRRSGPGTYRDYRWME